MTEPNSLTVSEAARVVAGYVSMVVGKPIDPDPSYAALHGCRTNAGMMPDGPPWLVYRKAVVPDPAPDLVEAALTRMLGLYRQDMRTALGLTGIPNARDVGGGALLAD